MVLIAGYNNNARNVCDTLDIIMLIELLTVTTDELTKIVLVLGMQKKSWSSEHTKPMETTYCFSLLLAPRFPKKNY